MFDREKNEVKCLNGKLVIISISIQVPTSRASGVRGLPGRDVSQADLRDLQPGNAAYDSQPAHLCRPADQCDGGVLPDVAGEVHAGHAAPLRLLAA